MISKAVAKYAKISPRKVRLVLALIKGKNAEEAVGILKVTNKKVAGMLIKLLNSAIANAKRFPNVNLEELYISDIYADGGPVLKRFRAEALGRASVLRKPTSHITVILDIRQSKKETPARKAVSKTAKKTRPVKAEKEKRKKTKDKKDKKNNVKKIS
jgi:large subunit ribosomal protein L22